jgi:hypothetical protein
MTSTGYKVLGFVVWNGAKWYVRRRTRQMMPSRRVAMAGLVAGGVAMLAVAGARRG